MKVTRYILSGLAFSVLGFAQGPAISAVVNAGTNTPVLCPGLIANIYGANFGSNLSNVSVTVGGKNAPIQNNAVTPTQFSVEIPFELSPGSTSMVVSVNAAASASFPITLVAAAPFILTQSGTTGPAAVYKLNATTPYTLQAPAHPSDSAVTYAIGLGATSPVTPTGPAPVLANVSPLPTVTVGGVNAPVTFAGVPAASVGLYQLNFTIPAGVQGTQPLVVTASGQSSPSNVTLPLVGLTSLVNNASFANAGTVAPGQIATVFANSLGTTTDSGLPPNKTLFPVTAQSGVQVTFNGTAAPLFDVYASGAQQQVDLFVPSELPATGTVNVQLLTGSAFYPNYTLKMVPANPGLYRITDPKTSTQYVTAQFANSAWLALPVSTTTNIGLPACVSNTNVLSTCGRPATIGDYLVLYLTGLGQATVNGAAGGKTLPTGSSAPADGSVLYETPTLPVVTIGGVQATVLFSGLAPNFAGLYQVDVQVPAGVASGDNVPVMVTMLGASDTAAISIQPRN